MIRSWTLVAAGVTALLLAPDSGQAKAHHRAAPASRQAKAHRETAPAHTNSRVAARGKAPARGRKPSARAVRASSRTRHGRPAPEVARAPVASWRTRQLAPSSDRYLEIQQALAAKGYLKSTPTGAWDADSQDALKRFQADQHLQQTGKLNSLSLIALGLGPAKTEGAPAPPPQPAPSNALPLEP